jgi:hypothetical protein
VPLNSRSRRVSWGGWSCSTRSAVRKRVTAGVSEVGMELMVEAFRSDAGETWWYEE